MIRVVCKGKLKPDADIEEYLSLAREVVLETRKEKGCRMYTYHQDINDLTILTTIEEWENDSAGEQRTHRVEIKNSNNYK